MSHELRTPLNAIMGFAQLMEMDIPKYADDPRFANSVQQILSSSHQLLELIDQVLDLSKIENGLQDVCLEDIPIEPLFNTVQDGMKSLAEKYKVRVERADAACWQSRVHADSALLHQAVQHLLSNAIKYNRPGGRAELACALTDNGHFRLSVIDTGRGVAKDKLDQLFTPFARLGAETSVIQGTGIGLVITKKLVENMGGEIGLESVVGTGSTFWIELPLAQGDALPVPKDEAPEQEPVKEAVAPPTKPDPVVPDNVERSVLYVEDSPANIALMEQYFSVIPGGPKLTVVETGEDGFAFVREQCPGMVLMDINLPGISGLEAMQQIRKLPACGDLPIVAISADAMPDEIEKALASGFDDYLTKPIQLKMLKDVIERNLGAFEA